MNLMSDIAKLFRKQTDPLSTRPMENKDLERLFKKEEEPQTNVLMSEPLPEMPVRYEPQHEYIRPPTDYRGQQRRIDKKDKSQRRAKNKQARASRKNNRKAK